MAYSASKIEFLRFGSQHGGEGIGCCAVDIIQGFVNDPDAPAHVKLYDGDRNEASSGALTIYRNGKTEYAYLGKTNREVFENYLRIGTFGINEMPDHGFIAILTHSQLKTEYGKKWLALLKENGFEFIRTINNSVYTDSDVEETPNYESSPHKNYIFALFRNISNSSVKDPFTPPKEWSDLPEMTMTLNQLWLSKTTQIYTESEILGESVQPSKASPFAAPKAA
jgi:hypothetical protein